MNIQSSFFNSLNHKDLKNSFLEYSYTYLGITKEPNLYLLNKLASIENVSPSITNFRIRNEEPNRVYFESSELITGNDFKGFNIGDKKIISISINSGNESGHYFTVSSPFNFWDNCLIRYEGGSNLVDLEGDELHKFTLRYIINSIEEPKTSINYFVSLEGNDSNDGLSEKTAWRTISKAGIMATFGSTVWIKAGDYGAENVIITNNGQQNKPIKFIGYNDKLNETPAMKRTIGMNFDSSEMPFLKNGEGVAINCNSKYLIMRNIQIDGYSEYGINLNKTTYFIADNIYIKNSKRSIKTQNPGSTNNRVINSYIANSAKNGVHLQNKNNLIDNTWAISSRVVGMDYYITLYGGHSGDGNIIRNCFVNRFPDDSHSGHGISLKGDQHGKGYFLEYNLVENCSIIGSQIELRHRPVKYNVIRDCVLDGNRGINVRDGASYNVIEKTIVKNAKYFVNWLETIEDGGMNENGHHNVFKNCVVFNVNRLFAGRTYESEQEKSIKNNVFLNCTFNNIDRVYSNSMVLDSTNKITNSIFVSVKSLGNGNLDIKFSYSNFFNSFNKPIGDGNISVNPCFTDTLNSDYTLSNSTPVSVSKGGDVVPGLHYDKIGVERTIPYSMGAFEKN